jgi:hypothetical protein
LISRSQLRNALPERSTPGWKPDAGREQAPLMVMVMVVVVAQHWALQQRQKPRRKQRLVLAVGRDRQIELALLTMALHVMRGTRAMDATHQNTRQSTHRS